MRKYSLTILAAVLLSHIGCGANQRTDSLERAVDDQWITDRGSDGALVVKLKPDAQLSPEIYSDFSRTNVTRAVEQAADSLISNDHPNAYPDVRVALDQGVATLFGTITAETEAVRIINAALRVEGVHTVHSHLRDQTLTQYGSTIE